MLRHLACCFTLIAPLYAANARAQDDEGPQTAQVTIHSAPDVELQIVGRAAKRLAKCRGECAFWALPGRYTVYTLDHSTGDQHELTLRVTGFAEYQLNQGNDTLHDLGVGLGYAGAAASVTGLLMALSLAMTSACESDCATDGDRRTAKIGLWVMASGVATGISGAVLALSNRTELQAVDRFTLEQSLRLPRLRVGLLPVSGGLGLGVAARF